MLCKFHIVVYKGHTMVTTTFEAQRTSEKGVEKVSSQKGTIASAVAESNSTSYEVIARVYYGGR